MKILPHKFFSGLVPSGIEPWTSRSVVERATDVATEAKGLQAQKLWYIQLNQYKVLSVKVLQCTVDHKTIITQKL